MKKRMLIMGSILLLVSFVFADYIVDFEGAGETKTGYASGNVTLSGLSWNLTEVLIGPVGATDADWYNGTRAARFRGYGTSAITMNEDKQNGIGTISFLYRRYGSEGQVDWKVEYSTDNGVNWIQAGDDFTASEVVQTFSHTVNVTGGARIRIKRATESGTTNKRLNIDDITLTDYTPNVPLLSFNPGSLSGFGYEQGSGPSAAQSYTVTGTDLNPSNGNITVMASSAYEYSTTGSSFSSSLQLPYTGGQLIKTVYIRLKAGLAVGEYNENISHQGGGTTAQFGVSGSVSSFLINFDGSFTEDFATFVSAETLPSGWTLDKTYTYGGDFGYGTAGGLRGNGVLGMQLTASGVNSSLTAILTLKNNTGDTITSLNISYDGKVERNNQTGAPKWEVRLDGAVIPELEYDTAEAINKTLTATVGALNIAPGDFFALSWFTTSAGTSGTRKQIGFTNLDINTSIANDPQIHTNASLSPFATTLGEPSASQNYQLSGHYLSANIQVTAPSGFELSTDDEDFYPSLSLSPTFSGDIWVRMHGDNGGTYGGNIVHTSPGATTQNVEVYGSVSSGGGYAIDLFFSEYIEGSSYNKALEIFNGTGQTVDLSDYKVILFTNGSPTPSQTLALSGFLAHQEVYVLAHGSSNQAILAVADITNNSVCNFSGDDALALQKVSTGDYVDIFGVIGDDPGTAWTAAGGYSTLDKTLVRKPEVSGGVTVNPTGTGVTAFTTLATEWNLYDRDYSDDLGSHTFAGGSEEVQAPTVQASGIIAYPANDMMSLEWTPGNGARRIVKINTSNSFTAPADGSDPIANPVYNGSGEQVIFKGSTQIIEDSPYNGCLVSGLQPDTAYWFRIYEFNGSGTQTKYLSSTAMDNPLSATTTDTSQLGYYDGIYGYGTTLKSNLHTLLRTTHSTWFSYNALWNQLAYTDQDPDNPNNIIEIYTGWSVPISHQGGGTTQWNREHTWSKSHGGFGDTAPAGTDLHHMRPCDATVNSSKGNRDFDIGSTPHNDASPYPGYSGVTGCYTDSNIWEPRDEDKGDVARMMMYMAVRYEGTDTSYDLELVDYINSSPSHQPYYGKLSTLLQWHIQDPPDSRERQRNERIFERQGNRNPFIDVPLFAHQLWSPVPTHASSLSQTGFTANWSTPLSATKYYLQVVTDTLTVIPISGYNDYDAGLSNAKAISGLSSGNTYYYRLRSYFVSGYSMYSPWLTVNLPTPNGTATLTALGSVYEYDLDGLQVNITLQGASFTSSSLNPSHFTLQNAPAGLTIANVTYQNISTATLTLSFDGSDFDDNYHITILISPAVLSQTTAIQSSSLQLIAYIETPLTIEFVSDQITLNISEVQDADSYIIFSSVDPYAGYIPYTAMGYFDAQDPKRWIQSAATQSCQFYKAAAIKN